MLFMLLIDLNNDMLCLYFIVRRFISAYVQLYIKEFQDEKCCNFVIFDCAPEYCHFLHISGHDISMDVHIMNNI